MRFYIKRTFPYTCRGRPRYDGHGVPHKHGHSGMCAVNAGACGGGVAMTRVRALFLAVGDVLHPGQPLNPNGGP